MSNTLHLPLSKSQFIAYAAEGYPALCRIQLELPDVPACLPILYTRVVAIETGRVIRIEAEIVVHTYSQDTRMVIDNRVIQIVNDFRKNHGVVNTYTDSGTVLGTRNRG